MKFHRIKHQCLLFSLILLMLFGCTTKRISPQPEEIIPTVEVTEATPGVSKPVTSQAEVTTAVKDKKSSPQSLLPVISKEQPVGKEEEYIVLNFDQADLEIVLQTISEIVGMNYILGPRVKGKITIQTYKKIPRKDLLQVLHSILEVNGMTTVKSGHYYKIIPLATAKQYPIETRIGAQEEDIPLEDVAVTQIVPLEYIAADEISRLIKPLVSKSGSIITHKTTNILILNDIASNIKRLLKLVSLLDVPTQLASGEQVFVYYVENGQADKLASILNSVYKKKTKDKGIISPVAKRVEATIKKKSSVKEVKRKVTKVPEGVIPELEGELSIVAYQEINALIIKTTPRSYEQLVMLLERLDILPKQVLIEVLIADISLDDSTSFGLEWAARTAAHSVGSHKGFFPQIFGFTPGETISIPDTLTDTLGTGLSYIVAETGKMTAVLNLQAVKGNVNILSSPHILATDNQEADISIVDQIPIQKVTYTGDQQTPVYSYEFKDAGIKLKVTPNINEKGLVNLKVGLEVSEVGKTTYEGQVSFIKRNANTSVIVQSDQTLVIGGLIKERRTKDRTGIPFLMDIPLLGYLFGSTTTAMNKTELVMLITPRVIGSEKESAELTKQFQKHVESVKKAMEQK